MEQAIARLNELNMCENRGLSVVKGDGKFSIMRDDAEIMSEPLPASGSHKIAKQQLAARYLEQCPPVVSVTLARKPRTVACDLNDALQMSGFSVYAAEYDELEMHFVCTLTTKHSAGSHVVTGRSGGSKGLALNNAALDLLHLLAVEHPEVAAFQTVLVQHGQGHVFPCGGRSSLTESLFVEFKGTRPNHSIQEVLFHFQKSKKDKREIGEYICSFLNASGGSIFIGIEDNGDITGAKLCAEERDKLKDRLDKVLMDIQPPCRHSVKMYYHNVIDCAEVNPSVQRELRALSDEAQLYIAHLKAKAKVTDAAEVSRVVVEVRVIVPETRVVYGHKGVAYIRMDALTREMTVAELRHAFQIEFGVHSSGTM
jgi:hypothetical protein